MTTNYNQIDTRAKQEARVDAVNENYEKIKKEGMKALNKSGNN